jgi:FAD/FMN-containing dehydrogenase
MSRMWGSTLDHVLEVEVVTADGKIQRASATENSDLFWVWLSLESASRFAANAIEIGA